MQTPKQLSLLVQKLVVVEGFSISLATPFLLNKHLQETESMTVIY